MDYSNNKYKIRRQIKRAINFELMALFIALAILNYQKLYRIIFFQTQAYASTLKIE